MRDLHELDQYRIDLDNARLPNECFGGVGELDLSKNGAFVIQHHGILLKVLAACGKGWDHVSVSTPHRIPTWPEMDFIKRLFFEDDEVAMQLHVTPKDHINNHPFVLHLWRPRSKLRSIPLPPKELV